MIVVAGEALIDLVVHDGTVTARPGGAPYNVARGCARLGAPTALLGAISDDGFGHLLANGLADANVDPSLLRRTARPTTLAVAEVDAAGVASYHFYIAGTSSIDLDPVELPAATTTFITGGLGLAVDPMATQLEELVASMPATTIVIIDVNCRPPAIADRDAYLVRLQRVLRRADVLKVSVEDLAYLAPSVDPATAARSLLGPGVSAVFVTSGAGHTRIVTATDIRLVAVPPVEIVDTIGAGDAFTAGIAAWWAARGNSHTMLENPEELECAVHAAHAVAAIVVGRHGSDPPTRSELPPPW